MREAERRVSRAARACSVQSLLSFARNLGFLGFGDDTAVDGSDSCATAGVGAEVSVAVVAGATVVSVTAGVAGSAKGVNGSSGGGAGGGDGSWTKTSIGTVCPFSGGVSRSGSGTASNAGAVALWD